MVEEYRGMLVILWRRRELTQPQARLPPGSTAVPIILSTDKTRLTTFVGGKQAWPVYMTIGNISKELRRDVSSGASILIGYLPVAKLSSFKSSSHSDAAANLFHHAMSRILAPLEKAGTAGVMMGCADGYARHCFPILAAYVADNPEQCLIACCKTSRCFQCKIHTNQRGEHARGEPRNHQRTADDLYSQAFLQTTTTEFNEDGLNPVGKPFWANLPHTDIFRCLTPDLLHQIHRGVFKDHLLKWCQTILGTAEFDCRYAAIPSHSDVRHFDTISGLSQTNRTEHKNMEKVFVGVVSGSDPRLVRAATAMMDFVHFASLPAHTDATLLQLEDALHRFHVDKDVFIDLKGRDSDHFNLNKLHALMHYAEAIRSHGSLDGYNTEWSERLHIEFAKKGYRASNHVNYTAQMTSWMRRREAITFFRQYVDWAVPRPTSATSTPVETTTTSAGPTSYSVSKTPTWPNTSPSTLEHVFGCTEFVPTLHAFLNDRSIVSSRVKNTDSFSVYTRLSLKHRPSGSPLIPTSPDEVIRAGPLPSHPASSAGSFDTVLSRRYDVRLRSQPEKFVVQG
jgi:hypothetical protein